MKIIVELLEARKADLEKEVVDYTAEIDKRVAEFRAKLESEYAEKNADVALEIKAIDRLILKEMEKGEAEEKSEEIPAVAEMEQETVAVETKEQTIVEQPIIY